MILFKKVRFRIFLILVPSLLVSIVIIYLLPDFNEKYKITLLDQLYSPHSQLYFHDLDGDGNSEWIEFNYNEQSNTFPYIAIYRKTQVNLKRDVFVDYIDLPGPWLEKFSAFFGDYNNDKYPEIYYFTPIKDSLFLIGIDPVQKPKIFLKKNICPITIEDETTDTHVYTHKLIDINQDSIKEIIFTVSAGRSLYPRAVYIYNFASDKLIKSVTEHAALGVPIVYTDSETDKTYIYVCSYAPGNNSESPLYSDSSAWLFFLDENLDCIRDPVEFPGIKPTIIIALIKGKGDPVLFSFENDYSLNFLAIKLYRYTGELIKERQITAQKVECLLTMKNDVEEKVYFYESSQENLSSVDVDLNFSTVSGTDFQNFCSTVTDINQDHIDDVIAINKKDYQVAIFSDLFKESVPIPFQLSSLVQRISSFTYQKNNYICLNCLDHVYLLKFYKNPNYELRYLVYLAIFLSISLFIYLISWLEQKNTERRLEQKYRMMSLELSTIKNQIEPHLSSNILNSVAASIGRKEYQKAIQMLSSYAELQRAVLKNARRVSITLEQEVEFVKKYLLLEQERKDKPFDYQIHIAKEVKPDIRIPKMIIQTFVENAVKHAFGKNHPGMIKLDIQHQHKDLKIEITDNGTGRKTWTTSPGKGLEIIDHICRLFEEVEKRKVGFIFTDLFDDQARPSGTKVTIQIEI